MKRVACLLLLGVLVIGVAPLLAQDAPKEETARDVLNAAHRAFNASEDEIGRWALRRLIDQFPDSHLVPTALRELALHHDGTTDGRAQALACLRRLARDYAFSNAARDIPFHASRIAGWEFTDFPYRVPVGKLSIVVDANTGPRKRTYRVSRVPAEARRRALEQGDPFPSERTFLKEYVHRFEHHAALEIELPEPGVYEIEEEVEGFTTTHTVRAATFGIGTRTRGSRGFVQVLNLWTGEPIAMAEVSIRQEDGVTAGKTDPDGLFFFNVGSRGVAIATVGDETWSCRVESDAPKEEALVFLTTDRPIYRPGHVVHFKAIRRYRVLSVLSTPKEETVRLTVRGPEGRSLWTRDLPWNEAGAVSGSFTLSDEPALGDYAIVAHVATERYQPDVYYEWFDDDGDGPNHWRKLFRVAAYRKPEARVIVTPIGRTPDGKIRARIRAEYWFGGPVANAEVYWRAETRFKGESGWDEGFLADSRAWFFTERREPWDDYGGWGYDSDEFTDGEGVTDEDGTLTVEFDPPAEFEEIVVHAIVEDATGLASEGSGTVGEGAPGRGSSVITLITPRIALAPGETVAAEVQLKDSEGALLSERDVHASVLVSSGEAEWESVQRMVAVTDATGRCRIEFPAPRVSRFRLKVASPGAAPVRRSIYLTHGIPREDEIEGISLRPDRYISEPGETLRMLVRSRESLPALLVVEGDEFHEIRPIRIEPGCRFIEIEVRPEHAPNLFVSLLALRDGESVGESFEVFVYPAEKLFDLAVTAGRDSYGPGEAAEVVVTATGPDGSPVDAEVEIAVVDESVLALRPDATSDIRTFFHLMRWKGPREGIWRSEWSNRSFKWDYWDEDSPPLFGKADEGEQLIGGGAEEEDGGAPGVRRLFPDTLLYRAHARTGEDGRCRVEVETPGSLTTWRIVARAVAGADRFGQGVSSVVTTKDVVLRLAAPRFLVVGDEGVVVGVLRSDLPIPAEFKVSLTAEGVETEPEPQTVTLDPGTEIRVEFPIRAIAPGTATLNASAVSPAGSDAIELALPVKMRDTPMHLSRSGRVDGTLEMSLDLPPEVAPEKAGLEIWVTSRYQAILETLPFLAGYPYGCVEQTMSRFLPSVVAARALRRMMFSIPAAEQLPDMVNKGLQRLYRFQHEDGGFGWWENDETHPFMTAYVVYGLLTARDAGFPVDETSLRRAVDAIEGLDAGPFGMYARVLAGREVPEIMEAVPKDPEERAWLALAGRWDLVAGITMPPEDATGPEWIRIAALNVRALLPRAPEDTRVDDLIGWILERRTGRGWYSTLDSAYVIYALAEVTRPDVAEEVRIRVNGTPIPVTGARTAVPLELLKTGPNVVEISAAQRSVYATARLGWFGRTEGPIPAEAGAFAVARRFERAVPGGEGDEAWAVLGYGDAVEIGDEIRVVLRVDTGEEYREYVMIECPTPAGFEPQPEDPYDDYWWDSWYQRREIRDDRVCIAARELSGQETFEFRFRATFRGVWRALPATAFEMYQPDRAGRSAGMVLRVE